MLIGIIYIKFIINFMKNFLKYQLALLSPRFLIKNRLTFPNKY